MCTILWAAHSLLLSRVMMVSEWPCLTLASCDGLYPAGEPQGPSGNIIPAVQGMSKAAFSALTMRLVLHTHHFIQTLQFYCFLLFSCQVQLFTTPWTIAPQPPLSSNISQSLLKFMSIELVMLSNHLTLCRLLLLLPLNLSQHQGFSNEMAFCIKWPKYWSFSIFSSYECSGLRSIWTD